MEIILKDTWTSGQGKILEAGDTIDCDRDTYLSLLSEGKCEPLAGDKKSKKKKIKKIETDGDNNTSTDN